MIHRKRIAIVGVAVALVAAVQLGAEPEYDTSGALKRPAGYREWVFLSSGLGMNYGPVARENPGIQIFDNVFVEPAAYRAFLETGEWPEGTMLALELRRAASEGSIVTAGRFQTGVMAVEIEVKDSARFPGGWGFYGFSNNAETATVLPRSQDCYSCHRDNGAVDNTFVQFYPTLLEIARQKGTLTPAYLESEQAESRQP